MSVKESPRELLAHVPAEAETAVPTRKTCPVFAWIVRMLVVSTIKAIASPSEGEAGSVAVEVLVMK